MKVVILCGGKGTRLREETEYRPKPMVPIGNYPILWHIMKTYAFFGHKKFVLCLGYKGEMIKDYFRNYFWYMSDVTLDLSSEPKVTFHDKHDEIDWKITLADTGIESFTANRIFSIKKYVENDDSFMLTYGDGLCDIDINELIDFHNNHNRICTITGVHPPGRFGELDISKDNRAVTGFNEKPQVEGGYISGGFMVCRKEIFSYLNIDKNVMFEREPIKKLVSDGEMAVFKHEGFWQCMDTYSEMQMLNSLWENNRAPWKKW